MGVLDDGVLERFDSTERCPPNENSVFKVGVVPERG